MYAQRRAPCRPSPLPWHTSRHKRSGRMHCELKSALPAPPLPPTRLCLHTLFASHSACSQSTCQLLHPHNTHSCRNSLLVSSTKFRVSPAMQLTAKVSPPRRIQRPSQATRGAHGLVTTTVSHQEHGDSQDMTPARSHQAVHKSPNQWNGSIPIWLVPILAAAAAAAASPDSDTFMSLGCRSLFELDT